ncbi:hypothetical protein [Aquimarina sp. 2201CG5-10]|uniref:hypothetical protein n=1 Tax=Aquimarina callyspongiae TaxID=3098150 RepID=UPI002AB40D8D|nr:hypothetical protein [Aquimarina sp. 2201CG5-10]MDY8137649.1 hypothetical protein [Aquimarina sp. 2201CG5-10]
MKIKKTIVKLIVYGTILLSTTFLFKNIAKEKTGNFSNIANNLSNVDNTSYYFVGSSRVQKSINPEILRKNFNNKNIHNVGISGSTFLSNCILAEYLIKKQKSSTIFIELSPVIPKLATGLIKFSDEVNLDLLKSFNQFNKYENVRKKLFNTLNVLNHYSFSKLTVKENIKEVLGQPNLNDEKRLMGFVSVNENNFNSTTPFITYKEINSSFKQNEELNTHKNYINHLLKLGKQYNSKVVFFLPVTYRNQKEKNIVIPLFQELPDSLKIKYSEKFIKTITDSKYLSDNNHLNNIGAKKYSQLLGPLLGTYFENK